MKASAIVDSACVTHRPLDASMDSTASATTTPAFVSEGNSAEVCVFCFLTPSFDFAFVVRKLVFSASKLNFVINEVIRSVSVLQF